MFVYAEVSLSSAIIQIKCFNVLGIFTEDSSETLKNVLICLTVRLMNLWKKRKKWKNTVEGIWGVQNRYTGQICLPRISKRERKKNYLLLVSKMWDPKHITTKNLKYHLTIYSSTLFSQYTFFNENIAYEIGKKLFLTHQQFIVSWGMYYAFVIKFFL